MTDVSDAAIKAIEEGLRPKIDVVQQQAGQAEPAYEQVDHPQHYNTHPSGVECWDIVEHLPFNVGTAIKHLWRNGLKPGTDVIIEYDKAIAYIEREKQRLIKFYGVPSRG